MKKIFLYLVWLVAALLMVILVIPAQAQDPGFTDNFDDPNPPAETVKLIFIHHSTGENWLTDGYGNLGRELGENNYFVSDTNYGWGPDSIGDRTDIPNWTEWFRSGNTPTYMNALFNESRQNSSYTRNLSDPGGENEIIMFKSCFPNSDLGGNPDDPPGTYEDMTVSGAKYVYNEILKHFATRPDKLFIVITAPPLSDPTNAANARAFNNWLVNDWLAENNYPYNNVAVFDFYNVLTAKDAHHWYQDGQIQHVVTNWNTLYYPSDDDHPSAKGSRKATDEFIPLLNIFYNRWASSGTSNLPPATLAAPTISIPQVSVPSGTVGLVADFDSLTPSLEAYWDEATSTLLTCTPASDSAYSGASALKIDFDVSAGSWSTCVLSYDNAQDWSTGSGLSFYIHASQAGIPYNVLLYTGLLDNTEAYVFSAETLEDSAGGWVLVEIPWANFIRASWESDSGAAFDQTDNVLSFAFGLDGLANANNTGTLWVDNVSLLGLETAPEPQPEPDGGSGLPCLGSVLLSLCFIVLVFLLRLKV
ncbi:MAG: hypothetical protein KJ606_10060 [Chloroflexi bacterium]|nr:hypothetical protein [Chloroflexota bacterium]